jgi:gamma-glutamyl-gamma-aminobutyraldehyde dehydrogenase
LDVERAVGAAAIAGAKWATTSAAERKRVLNAWADAIERHQRELAVLLTLEIGKPVRAAFEVETRSLLRSVRWYAEITDKFMGGHPDTGNMSVAIVDREAVGVVAVVLPWNFPLSMVGYDVAPALAAGNAVVVKPSPKAPLAVLRVCELAIESGLPPNVLSVTPDTGEAAGAALARHLLVDVVSVTGGEAVGRAFMGYAAETKPKRIWPKLGGKSFVAVGADAPNLDQAAAAVAWGAFFNQGAMCTGAARIFAEQPIFDEFCELLAGRVGALITGDPLHWPTDVGAISDELLFKETATAVSEAIAAGGRCLTGTGKSETFHELGGLYMRPCLLAGLPFEHSIYSAELFGPVAAVAACDSTDDVVERANRSRFGMAISIWTGSLHTALRNAKASKVGTVWVNCFESDDLSVPFGGVRRSGYGKDKSMAAIEKYTDVKTTWIQLDESSYW